MARLCGGSRKAAFLLWLLVAGAAPTGVTVSKAAARPKEIRRVLVLNDLGRVSSAGFVITDGTK